ncbi:MAG: hypothetical protein IJ602_05675 [Paludibacteraceae bacterium]|nr:hypothetical protein [Paludibacteraceae bacterium]
MKRLVQIILVAALAMAAPVQAVTKYTCDFESQASRDRWVLNPGTNYTLNNLKNKWYIGEPGNNDRNGSYGLFVSDDNGASAHYTNAGCWVYAYDTVSLDPLAGNYTIYFDYCVMANVASKFDGLYLLWVPESVSLMSIPTSDGNIPDECKPYVIPLQPNANMNYLNGTATWKQCVARIPGSQCDGTPHRLVFVWTNGSFLTQQPGAKVDNIVITDVPPCDAPTSVVITPNGTTVSVEWTGTADTYEVSAYSYDGLAWAGPKIVTGNQTNFSNLAIGQTDFIVRAVCDEYSYSLKTIESKLIYYPDQLCVDYLNLDNAVCYISNPDNFPSNTDTYNDFIRVPAVDRGASSIDSRHVVHFDRTETEPRTGGLAKTIPDGELASVRLGNWGVDDGGARIEFSFPVDTIKYPVLLLKYMPVLEAPTHPDYENPRFILDILIGGTSIGRCGMADFNANNVKDEAASTYDDFVLTQAAIAQGWHKTSSKVAQTHDDVIWKEWTTVGVNLKKPEYAGKMLTARLTTYDCPYHYHGGYAYFTLGCSDGKLKGMKCGEINPEFTAPDGFEYRWAYAYNEKYRRANGSLPEQYVLGRGQNFNAGYQDDSLYVVDCMFVQDSTCFFSLYASTLATNPVSVIKKPQVLRHCTGGVYKVKLDASDSWVQEIDHVTHDTLRNKNYHIESYEWNIEGLPYGWSDEATPTFDLPAAGGVFPISLRTTCGTCESIVYDTLRLEPLGPTHETQSIVLCDEDRKAGYVWAENTKVGRDTTYRTYGLVDSVTLYSEVTTCDSIIYLELKEPVRNYHDTMLLPESLPFTYMGRTYGKDTKTMVDTIPMQTNCAITYVLNLEIYESLIASMPNAAYQLCEGDPTLTLVYDIARGRSLRYSYTFDNPALPSEGPVHGQQPKGQYQIDIPVDASLRPDVYTGSLLLVDSMPEFNVTIPFTVSLRYASDVITQRWNDVLAIRNADYNGGYQFDSVQWYINGMPIEGATDFVYYTGGNGVQLRFGEEYQALLMRRDDGVKQFTCPFIPAAVAAEVKDMPSLVPPSAPLQMRGKGTAYWYDMLGNRHGAQTYDNSEIRTPAAQGCYLLILNEEDARAAHRILVK